MKQFSIFKWLSRDLRLDSIIDRNNNGVIKITEKFTLREDRKKNTRKEKKMKFSSFPLNENIVMLREKEEGTILAEWQEQNGLY